MWSSTTSIDVIALISSGIVVTLDESSRSHAAFTAAEVKGSPSVNFVSWNVSWTVCGSGVAHLLASPGAPFGSRVSWIIVS